MWMAHLCSIWCWPAGRQGFDWSLRSHSGLIHMPRASGIGMDGTGTAQGWQTLSLLSLIIQKSSPNFLTWWLDLKSANTEPAKSLTVTGPKIHWLHYMAKESHEVTLVLREGEICSTSWWEEQHRWNWGGHFCRSSTMERWVGCWGSWFILSWPQLLELSEKYHKV